MNFSSRLKALRKSQKITQESLAKIIGVERSSVGKYEANNVIPSIDVLNRIADYFNVSVDYLLGRETNDIYASIGAMPVKKNKAPRAWKRSMRRAYLCKRGFRGVYLYR